MNHFEPPHLNVRKPPKPGDTVWIVPIRYWEPADYSPERLDVESVTADSLYGFHHGNGHNVYVSRHDAKWFYDEALAREAQLSLARLSQIIECDDTEVFVRDIMERCGRSPENPRV